MVKEMIVEDFENLDGLSLDKAKKLLHKAQDYERQTYKEHQQARDHMIKLQLYINSFTKGLKND
mgnify:CR=1 FL=1|jgi:antirestriction protein